MRNSWSSSCRPRRSAALEHTSNTVQREPCGIVELKCRRCCSHFGVPGLFGNVKIDSALIFFIPWRVSPSPTTSPAWSPATTCKLLVESLPSEHVKRAALDWSTALGSWRSSPRETSWEPPESGLSRGHFISDVKFANYPGMNFKVSWSEYSFEFGFIRSPLHYLFDFEYFQYLRARVSRCLNKDDARLFRQSLSFFE